MHMERKRKVIIGAVSAFVLAGGGAAVAQAVGGGEEAERSVTGAEADRASRAAVELVPGGDARAVERDGEKGAVWEVEVKKPDGTVVDVRLSGSFEKVSIDSDSESADAEPDTREK
ncbi:MAG: hypothetical protein JWO90_3141 [Solirubrobacterales bacterium]|nr:hypothetical protein [Solirubrobacterales bacterium]